ncbi:MAG: protein kinase [Acidobacteria bacterium]|nr:protein kinase [Acidobacteriota bacterium]
MSPERWERVKDIFDAALDLDAAARPGFLAQSCLADEELRAEVERLLSQHEQADSSFLRTPPGGGVIDSGEEVSRQGLTLNGRYRIERELGRGGSGVVYLARDEQLLDRLVVVKFLHERVERHPVLRARFRSEMEALARISHPGVVSVLDVGELHDGARYLVMEYVEGVTLRSEINAGGLELHRAARLVRHICAALTAAHEKGIFHRDLKPENIMVLRAGEEDESVKLIDFGIAKVEQSQLKARTETWTFVGTINYVSPEQLLGKAGTATDIWALGVIAYEMVTGRRPYQPETPFHLYEMQRSQRFPDPARLRRRLPAGARAAILKALSFRPEDRQPTPAEFAREFASALDAGRFGDSLAHAWIAIRRPRMRLVTLTALAALSVLSVWLLAGRVGGLTRSGSIAANGVRALDLSINTPTGVAMDSRGNVYFSEYANNRVWRVDRSGMAAPFAGTGLAGFTGNGGLAVRAQIESPRTLTVDGDKYLYLVETTTDRVRRVDLASGIISHVLGTGRPRFNGDGRPAVETSFSEGLGLAVDSQGNLYFADTNNHRIRRLSAADGLVSTIAGTGTDGSTGDGGPAVAARLARPSGLALHPNGDLYLFEVNTQRLRRIRDGRIETIAGSEAGPMEGPAGKVRLGPSTGIAIDPQGENLYFTEESLDTVRKLHLASGLITIVAGNGTSGYSGDGGPARMATMANPTGIAVDREGFVYVAEAMSNRIRRISPAGVISTFAGGKVPYARDFPPLGLIQLARQAKSTARPLTVLLSPYRWW